MKRSLPLFILLAPLGACANPYAQFYTDLLEGKPVAEFPMFVPFAGEPKLFSTDDMDRDSRALQEDGYSLIGFASFNASVTEPSKALQVATQVGAEIVLVMSQYTNTISGTVPYTVQNPSQTVTTNHSGTVYGSGSYANYYGRSTTTIPGGYTTYQIPYSVARYDYGASFWVKLKPPILGLHVLSLTDELRRQIGGNRGVVVDVVMKGSPAFNADIIRGDIVTKLGDSDITSPGELGAANERYAGQEVNIRFLRDGKVIDRAVRLNTRSF